MVFDHGPTTKVNDNHVMTLLLSLTYILADGGTHAATMILLRRVDYSPEEHGVQQLYVTSSFTDAQKVGSL